VHNPPSYRGEEGIVASERGDAIVDVPEQDAGGGRRSRRAGSTYVAWFVLG
jgi:hypothetical protein